MSIISKFDILFLKYKNARDWFGDSYKDLGYTFICKNQTFGNNVTSLNLLRNGIYQTTFKSIYFILKNFFFKIFEFSCLIV